MKNLVQLILNKNRGLLYYETKIYHIAISGRERNMIVIWQYYIT